MVLVVNLFAVRFRTRVQAVKAPSEVSLFQRSRSIQSSRRALVLACYDEKREIGMELESEWNPKLRWFFVQQGSRREIFRHQ